MLSIIIPSIRREKLDAVYNSIHVDFPWEFIVISPYENTDYLKTRSNVKYINDFGNPTRCSCLGASIASGEIITHGADDCRWISETLIKCVDLINNNKEEKFVVVTKYYEGSKVIQNDDYYKVSNAYLRSPFISEDWVIFNTMFMRKSYFDYLGGWDSSFEVTCIAHCDLAIRAQRDNAIVHFVKEPLLECDHYCPCHKPIEDAQNTHDTPLLRSIYTDGGCVNRIRVDLNNWKYSPLVWNRRFPRELPR